MSEERAMGYNRKRWSPYRLVKDGFTCNRRLSSTFYSLISTNNLTVLIQVPLEVYLSMYLTIFIQILTNFSCNCFYNLKDNSY